MAMLAEPRQRKRYNLVPRGKALYEDDSRFGTKMLEKMGWQKGKGLGANEDGTKDFVRLRYKNDALGLGFEHRDDQWTQHEQSFNGLLKTLNNEEDGADTNVKDVNGNGSDDDLPRIGFGFQNTSAMEAKPKVEKLKEKISGISLEERSKKSKARVHYKKFTKGKDLAQYSEKDLANIFGKKVADEQQSANDFYQQLNNTFVKKQEETKDEQEEPKGVQIINTGISVSDYFKSKMEALRNRKNGYDSADKNIISNEVQLEDDIPKKNKKKNKKDQDVEEENSDKKKEETNNLIINSNISVTENNVDKTVINDEVQDMVFTKKKKKNKKEVKDKENIEELENDINNKEEKKNNNSVQENSNSDEIGNTAEISMNKEKKSKKSKAVDILELSSEEKTRNKQKYKTKKRTQETGDQNEEIELPLKKNKKSDNLPTENTIESAEVKIEIDLTQEPTKKKQKKSKTKESNEIIEIDDSDKETNNFYKNEGNLMEKQKKKKSKKTKELTESLEKDENSFLSNPTKNALGHPLEMPTKAKRKDVSSSAKNVFINDINVQILDLDELKKKYEAFNIYPISSFCAEKFRNISLNDFTGSILPQIEGYGLDPHLQLDVKIIKNDEERISNLWKGVLNKYVQLEKPKKTYQHYVRNVINARKTKQKRPKLYVKTWKRKNAFQAI